MSNILKYQNPSSPLLIQKVNQSGANFVKRLLDPNRKSIPDWETKGQKIATHKMSWGEDEHGAYVFPEVQEIDGQLIDFSRPPYAPGIADYMAHKNNNIIRMSPEEADWFTRNYKQYYPSFKKGGRIHIKKKNRGSFTRWCKGKVTEECIRRGKNSPSAAIRKKATFASNSRRWKHENGGILKAQEGTGNLLTPHPLSPVGIALNQAKAMAKGKKDQQHLPPGVKEVVGPDGKKVAIRTEQPLVPLERSIAEWLPGTGDVAEVGYIANDIKNGNLGTAALAAGLTFIPGNWRKVLDALIPSKKDKFLDFFQKEIGKTVKRVPVTKNDFQGVYSEGFRYLDESGKEIAHIAGSRYGDRVFVESSFMDPEFRSKGIGKQMYFDFNDQMFNKYGKTIGSNSGQHMMTLETSPGIFISPSGRMWRGLRNKGLATTENPPIVSYIMAEPKTIRPHKKYSKGGKL